MTWRIEHPVEDGLDVMGCMTLHLTHEEEFKIFELHVRKENLNNGLFKLFSISLHSWTHFRILYFVRIMDQKSVFVESKVASGGTKDWKNESWLVENVCWSRQKSLSVWDERACCSVNSSTK